MSPKKIIEIKNLTKHYGDVVGIQNLSLDVYHGEIMGFLGPNGAGKTTTIRSCLDLIEKMKGTISIFGMDSHRDAVAIRRQTGYIPGDFGLIPGVSVRSYLKYLLSLGDYTSSRKMESLAKRLELDLQRKTNELSKGNRQKVGIVQALMMDQQLIIMDEPTVGLDPLMQQEFYRILHEEQKAGKTVFMSSHILAEVEQVCDRVAIIRNGELQVVEDIEVLQKKTGKILEVEFRGDIDLAEFDIPGVTDVQQEDSHIRMTVHSNLDAIIKQVANYPVLNMRLQTYNLEQLFLKYYSDEGGDDK